MSSKKKHHHHRKKRRGFTFTRLGSIAVVLAMLCVGVLWYCLEHYEPHAEVELWSVYISILCILADGFIIANAIYRKHIPQLLCGLGSIAVCAGMLWVAWSIPLCPICENLTEADLGLLRYWISLEH